MIREAIWRLFEVVCFHNKYNDLIILLGAKKTLLKKQQTKKFLLDEGDENLRWRTK